MADAAGQDATPNAIVVDREGDPQFVALEQPDFWLDPGPANALQFNRILAAAGFRCNVQESGVSCQSEDDRQGLHVLRGGLHAAVHGRAGQRALTVEDPASSSATVRDLTTLR